ncbi:MAG: thiol-activated cytolysin family protein [Myxococcota bacterium]
MPRPRRVRVWEYGWIATILGGFVGCVGDLGAGVAPDDFEPAPPEEPLSDPADEVNAYLRGLGHFDVDPAVAKTQLECDGPCDEVQEGDELCSFKSFTETRRFEEYAIFEPNSATLWPGNVVRGDDALRGRLTPIGVALAPVTFSLSLENLVASPLGEMPEPSLSAFRELRNELLQQGLEGSAAASLHFEIEQVRTADQVGSALGAGLDWPGLGSIAGSYDFLATRETTKLLVTFSQAYFTIDVDTKIAPADHFVPGTTVADLQPHMAADSPPMYVQSITYGRRVVFTVETEDSEQVVRKALEASYGGIFDANVELSANQQDVLSRSTIRAFVLGGSGESASGVIDGYEGIRKYIVEGSEYALDSPGAPIGYRLAYTDNKVATMAFTTDYEEKVCYPTQGRVTLNLERLHHAAGDEGPEVYGHVAIRTPEPGNPVVSCSSGGRVSYAWNAGSDAWFSMPRYGTWIPAAPLSVSIDDVPFGVGQKVCVTTSLRDHDGFLNGNEDLGDASVLIDWDQGWEGEHVLLTFGEKGNQMEVTTSIALE